jgi:MoxR-like ATPase
MESARVHATTPDRRDGAVYVFDESLRLAVDVALATHRPLLLRGEPGSGKSSLAAFIARHKKWRYYEYVVTARSRARDVLYTFDAVRKLADASESRDNTTPLRDERYIEPGALWWAFNRETASRRGAAANDDPPGPAPIEPNATINKKRSRLDAVVLVDEIDKADPDFPNGLLVPLGSGEFRTLETGFLVTQATVDGKQGSQSVGGLLVVITTNEERELPPAFLRRCVIHRLNAPGPDRLIEIGWAHLHAEGVATNAADAQLLDALASQIHELRAQATEDGRRPPSTAEFLDAVHACRRLKVTVGDNATWKQVQRLVLLKDDSDEDHM